MWKHKFPIYKVVKQTAVEYFRKTTLNGFALLLHVRRRKYQRTLWLLFILLGITFAVYVVIFILLNFLDNPTVIALKTQLLPNLNIPFPAIAICSANKFSRLAVESYVKENFANTSQMDSRFQNLFGKMHLLAGYYETEVVNVDDAAELQNILENMPSKNSSVFEMLQQLSPSCGDLILQCEWESEVSCTDLIGLYPTASGFCCIVQSQLRETSGIDQNLSILLNATTSDYFYTERSVKGFTVQVFNADRLPDASTGSLRELFVSPGERTDIEISIITQVTSKEAREYAVLKRACYYADELPRKYGVKYSQAECLTRCKLKNIFNLCGCVPYYYGPERLKIMGKNESATFCTLANLECMERYRVAWSTYRPIGDDAFFQELQDSIVCSHCLPLCDFNQYYLRKNVYKSTHNPENNILNDAVAELNLYMSTPPDALYQKNVLYNWYQILSTIGGVIGICMGCSLVSGFEIIYFVGFRFFHNIYKSRLISY